MAKAAAISATLVAAAGAAMPAAAQPADTAGGALPDIVGLRPGIPAQQAFDFLKTYNRAARVYVSDTPLGGSAPSGSKPFPYLFTLTADPNNVVEVISVFVTLPPSKDTVWRITRFTPFAEGQAPTVEKIIAALRAKYGPEAILVGNANMAANSRLAWYFDESGKRIERPGGLSPASCTGELGPIDVGPLEGHAPAYNLTHPLGGVAGCRAVVVVSAQLAPMPSNPVNFNVVGRLTVTVADLPLEARAHAATVAFIAKGAATEAEQERQREDKVAAPKL
jgi:hypothetical protein